MCADQVAHVSGNRIMSKAFKKIRIIGLNQLSCEIPIDRTLLDRNFVTIVRRGQHDSAR
jgi:hypothetical protein